MITRQQCRAARHLLGWDAVQLATAAKSTPITIHQFEMGQSKPRPVTLVNLRTALESAGIEFNTVSGSPTRRLKECADI